MRLWARTNCTFSQSITCKDTVHKCPQRTKTRRIFALRRFLSLFHFQSGESHILLVSSLPHRWLTPLSILLSFWKGVCVSRKSIAVFFFPHSKCWVMGFGASGQPRWRHDPGLLWWGRAEASASPKSVLSSWRTAGGIQREVTKGPEGQVLGKRRPLKLDCAFHSLVKFYCLL